MSVKTKKKKSDPVVVTPAHGAVSSKYDSERVEGVSDEDYLLGVRCRELRDAGEPWWAIARALELPGWGNSATEGKKGASRARSVYKAAFGSFPRTFKTGAYKGPVERNNRVRELKKQKRKDLLATAKAGKSVIGPDVSDEDVADMLKGRKIRWYSEEYVSSGIDYEAVVHPRSVLYIEGEGDDRVVQFREQHRRAPVGIRELPAQTRIVRLRQIYSVK